MVKWNCQLNSKIFHMKRVCEGVEKSNDNDPKLLTPTDLVRLFNSLKREINNSNICTTNLSTYLFIIMQGLQYCSAAVRTEKLIVTTTRGFDYASG